MQINVLLFKTYLFITREKTEENSIKNNKLKVMWNAPMWNDEFEFPDGSYCVSDILDYIIQ